MKNEMNNAFYTCPYCNEEYTEPSDLAHCILSCEEKKRVEEEKIKQEQLAAEKEFRKNEIEEAEKHYRKLLTDFIKDYGSYSTTRDYTDDDNLLFHVKPWRLFI